MKRNGKDVFYGLVLAGGKSKRMQMDKSLLNYHGKSQVEHCFDLLLPLCEQVFVSNRADQPGFQDLKSFSQIYDIVPGIGPLGGMLSAMTRHPQAAWLVLACDLPFVNQQTLKTLIENRNLSKMATCYQSAFDGLPEPLCAIYEPKSAPILMKFLTEGKVCPRKILIKSDVHLIKLQAGQCLDNINDPQERQRACDILNAQKASA